MPEENKERKEIKRDFVPYNFAIMSKLILKDLNESHNRLKFFKKYKKEDVINYLSNPQKSEKELREISQFLFNVSPHYKRLIKYFADMALFRYKIIPYGLGQKMSKKAFKNDLYKAADFLENMNISHEFKKIMTVAFREDIFYGYEHSNSTSYFIQKLDPDYCCISSNEDGIYNFMFDFSYFDSDVEKLKYYHPDFRKLYGEYLKDKKNKRWIELDSEKTICIKVNEDLEYCIPPFSGVFEYLFDIEDYKALQKARTEIDNYKLLVMEVPLRKDSDTNNDFAIELDAMQYFYNLTAQALPEGVGLAMSPTKMESFTFNKDATYKNNVEEATKAYWDGAGVAGVLFGNETSSGAVATLSIKIDAEMVIDVQKQIERWINRKLKFMELNFKVKMLEITRINEQEIQKSLLNATQYGVPVKLDLVASYGLTPSDLLYQEYLENNILKLTNEWIPLMSSHTISLGNEGGRPSNGTNTEEVTERGEKNDSNNPNNRG